MAIRIDAKGKRFTDVVTKIPMRTVIQTSVNRIEGTVHLNKGERLIDELNKHDQFIAVTEAVVYSNSAELLYTTNFLVLNRDTIEWITPIEEINDTEKS
jgi:hypothetical protein